MQNNFQLRNFVGGIYKYILYIQVYSDYKAQKNRFPQRVSDAIFLTTTTKITTILTGSVIVFPFAGRTNRSTSIAMRRATWC